MMTAEDHLKWRLDQHEERIGRLEGYNAEILTRLTTIESDMRTLAKIEKVIDRMDAKVDHRDSAQRARAWGLAGGLLLALAMLAIDLALRLTTGS